MNALKRIRTCLFGVTQSEMGRIAGVTQSTVSRWEDDDFQPSLPQLQRIRTEAMDRGLAWDDAFLFEPHNDEAA